MSGNGDGTRKAEYKHVGRDTDANREKRRDHAVGCAIYVRTCTLARVTYLHKANSGGAAKVQARRAVYKASQDRRRWRRHAHGARATGRSDDCPDRDHQDNDGRRHDAKRRIRVPPDLRAVGKAPRPAIHRLGCAATNGEPASDDRRPAHADGSRMGADERVRRHNAADRRGCKGRSRGRARASFALSASGPARPGNLGTGQHCRRRAGASQRGRARTIIGETQPHARFRCCVQEPWRFSCIWCRAWSRLQ
jgi:hypothetical protein